MDISPALSPKNPRDIRSTCVLLGLPVLRFDPGLDHLAAVAVIDRSMREGKY